MHSILYDATWSKSGTLFIYIIYIILSNGLEQMVVYAKILMT